MHEQFSLEKLVNLKKQYPDAKVLAHPECKATVLTVADVVGSTQALLNYSRDNEAQTIIVATESGILHEMMKSSPNKQFIPVPPEDSTCACNECNFMRLNTLEKLYNCLLNETPEVFVDETIREAAVKPILRMLEMSK